MGSSPSSSTAPAGPGSAVVDHGRRDLTVSPTPPPPRPRRPPAAPAPGRRAGGPRLPGIRPAALPAAGSPDWYRRAVFYEVLTRGFFDANNDGIGDIAGL